MKRTCILSPARRLAEEEQSLVWQKPPSHIESEAEKRIYREVVRNCIEYRYYPSEIVRAYENGWLLEIQEPTVIRDAAVLMALN